MSTVVVGDDENHPSFVGTYSTQYGWSGQCKLCRTELPGHLSASALVETFEGHVERIHG